MKYQSIKTLDFYINKYKRCVVLGNGTSVTSYVKQEGDFTIGVNDICKFMTPNILLIVDTRKQFKSEERAREIEDTDCIHFVRDEEWNFKKGKSYMFKLGCKGQFVNFDNKEVIDTGYDSPYMACILAAKLRFKEIAIIGVDYTDNHFYAQDGPHNLMRHFDLVDSYYKKLYDFLSSKGIKFVNLSKDSKLTSVPKISD